MTPSAGRGAVLITGCSSGIGRATALDLARSNRPVYATARRLDTLTELERAGCRILPLDVTDDESMRAAVGVVESECGAVGALVNNAGYAVYGPVEQVPIDDVRRQFETNVFGLARLTQLVLPAMRARRSGTIVNVSSMGGRVTLPGGAFYHASKYALEAISNALRFEVAPFGIAVVVVEPGPVDTPWNDIAMQSLCRRQCLVQHALAHLLGASDQETADPAPPKVSAGTSSPVLPKRRFCMVCLANGGARNGGQPRIGPHFLPALDARAEGDHIAVDRLIPAMPTWSAVAVAGKEPPWIS